MSEPAATADEGSSVYPRTRFTGTLSDGNHQVGCVLTAQVSSDGHLAIQFDDIPIDENTNFLFDRFFGQPKLSLFSLNAYNDEGHTLTSDNFYFDTFSMKDVAVYTKMSGRCTTAKITRKRVVPSDDRGRVTYMLRGFSTFRPLRTLTRFGELEMDGPIKEEGTKLSAWLQLQVDPGNVADEEKRRELIDFFEHMIYIMSFARGTLLKDPIRTFVHNDIVEIEVHRRTPAQRSFFPAISYTIQQPIFMQAAEGFFTRYQKCKHIRVAIEFLLVGSEYTDARLMMQTIAVEFLTNQFLSRHEQRLMDRTDFRQMRSKLCAALTASEISEGDKSHIWNEIAKSNRLPFRNKINKLVDKWSVPMVDIPSEMIGNLVKVRNAIAHGSILSEDRDTRGIDTVEMMLASRELLTRIIFLQIGYVGAYHCYLNGRYSRLSPSFARQ